MRKYLTEFGINSYCTHSTLLQQSELGSPYAQSSHSDKYHIYIIGQRPRASIVPRSIKFSKKNVVGTLQVQEKDSLSKYPFKVLNHFGTSNLDYVSEYPYNNFSILNSQKEAVLKGKVSLLAPNIGFLGSDFLDLEVLYVGQSYGEKGERNAFKRLENHSKLQKIYSQALSDSPDKEIWLILCSFEYQFILDIDGANKNIQFAEKDDQSHTRRVFDQNINERQHINFVEAGLINYFKPKYNEVFKNKFPLQKHKSYKECYDLEINHLSVVLETEHLGLSLWSDHQAKKPIHMAEFYFYSKEDREGMFDFLNR